MIKNKHKMGPDMRFEVLYDLFNRTLSETYYYPQFSTKSRRRLDNAFKRLIKSIIDIDDMELFSIGKIFLRCILPLAKHAVRVEEYKLLENRKNQEDKCEDTTDAESQTEEKQEPEQREKDGECHFSIEIPKDIPENALRKLLGKDVLQKLEEICKIIDK